MDSFGVVLDRCGKSMNIGYTLDIFCFSNFRQLHIWLRQDSGKQSEPGPEYEGLQYTDLDGGMGVPQEQHGLDYMIHSLATTRLNFDNDPILIMVIVCFVSRDL